VKKVELERKRWREAYPVEFNDGVRIGFFGKAKSARDPAGGDYPLGFHAWSIDRKNAWFCGFNLSYVKRKRTDPKGTTKRDQWSESSQRAAGLPGDWPGPPERQEQRKYE
jgi:hypothetical protein